MDKSELKGLLKGIGIAVVVCSTVFYGLILNYRAEFALEGLMTNEEIVEAARDLGMIYLTEIDNDPAENQHITEKDEMDILD